MAYNLKQTLNKEERLSPGHRMCAGCGATIARRRGRLLRYQQGGRRQD